MSNEAINSNKTVKESSLNSSENPSEFTNDSNYDNATFAILESILAGWQSIFGNIKHSYASTANSLVDEILVNLSNDQINQALNTFVVKNVGMLLELRLELMDGYMRLYCTADMLNMHMAVASNFKLTEARLDGRVQRFAFEQISDTDVLDLHSKSWWMAPAIKTFLKGYRTILRKDPLPFLLSLAPNLRGKPFIEYKGNIIYLEIGRWLKEEHKKYLKKVQINSGEVHTEQLLLKAQPNFGEILSFGDPNADVITEKDNPNAGTAE